MELFWLNDELKFRVHLKKGQLLKYLNKGSAHTNACLKAIPSGVLRRLASLTSLLPDNENATMERSNAIPEMTMRVMSDARDELLLGVIIATKYFGRYIQ